MRELNRMIWLISLLTSCTAIRAPADNFSSDASRPLSLKERAVVIFEHAFQLKPVPSGVTPSTRHPVGTTSTKPKAPSNQVILKFILLMTHNDELNQVQSRLVIFQNQNPIPNQSPSKTNKWFWSLYNKSLSRSEFMVLEQLHAVSPGASSVDQPELFSFPVGQHPISLLEQARSILLSGHFSLPRTSQAAAPPASLAYAVQKIDVTPYMTVEETEDEHSFLDTLGDRLQSIPTPLETDTSITTEEVRAFSSQVANNGIAGLGDEVTVSFPVDLSKAPFNSLASPFEYDAGSKKTFIRRPVDDSYMVRSKLSLYGYVADWITASYTANNSTPEARAGKEFFASTPVHVLIHKEGRKQRIDFYPTYFTGTIKQATINHDFAVVPKGVGLDIDYLTFFPYLWSYLDPGSNNSAAAATQAPPATDPANTPETLPPGGATFSMTDTKPVYTFPLPSLPTFNNDASGASAGIDFMLTPGDPESKVVPSIDVNGGKYFDHDFYNVSTTVSWKFTPFVDPNTASSDFLTSDPKEMDKSVISAKDPFSTWKGSYGPQFSRSVTPNGNSSTSKTSGMAAFSIEKDVGDDSYKWSETSGIGTSANNATGVNTDEYSGTTYAQQLWREHVPWDFGGTTEDYHDHEPPPDVVTMQIDLNEWTKPAEATQKSNFYTAAASRFHVGADIPTPPCGGPAEFIRADAFLTGGGDMGVAPDTDRFYGGNTGGQGDAGSDLPGPVVRSFGTGKLGVFPTSAKAKQSPVGALSFANLNLTLAFPIPGLAIPFLNPDEAGKLNHLFDEPISENPAVREIDSTLSNEDEINYMANYDYWFSAKPVFTMDAAWMGGPTDYRDRSLVSTGGGVEFSMAVLNLDVLYEVTIHDTSVRQQTLGENMIVQLTYDIHF